MGSGGGGGGGVEGMEKHFLKVAYKECQLFCVHQVLFVFALPPLPPLTPLGQKTNNLGLKSAVIINMWATQRDDI